MSNTLQGIIFGILSALCYSLMALCVKAATNTGTETLVFFRNFLCLIFLFLFAFTKNVSFQTNHKKFHLIRGIAAFIALYCFFYASKKIPLLDAILLVNTLPLFMPLIVLVAIRRKIPLRRWLYILVGFLGIGLILKPQLHFDWVYFIGIGAGFFGAIGLFSLRMLTKVETHERILFYFIGIMTVFSLIPMIILKPTMRFGIDWIFILLLGVISLLYQIFLTKTYTHIPASKAASFFYFSTLFGGIFDWMFWDNIPDLYALLGAILIIVGGLAILLDPSESSVLKQK